VIIEEAVNEKLCEKFKKTKNNERKFELGEELRKLEKMISVFDRHVFHISIGENIR